MGQGFESIGFTGCGLGFKAYNLMVGIQGLESIGFRCRVLFSRDSGFRVNLMPLGLDHASGEYIPVPRACSWYSRSKAKATYRLRVQGPGLMIKGSGFRVQGSGFRV